MQERKKRKTYLQVRSSLDCNLFLALALSNRCARETWKSPSINTRNIKSKEETLVQQSESGEVEEVCVTMALPALDPKKEEDSRHGLSLGH